MAKNPKRTSVHKGSPRHGQPHPDSVEASERDDTENAGGTDDNEQQEEEQEEEQQEDEQEEQEQPQRTGRQQEAPQGLTQAEIRALFAEEFAKATRSQQKPGEQQEQVQPPEDAVDWEDLMFRNPKEAVKLIKKQAVAEARAALRAEYQTDQGTKDFWNEFYRKNPDLNRDQDDTLVQGVMQTHMAELAPLPVSEASKKLAELTRDRIMQYRGDTRRNTSRVQVEGANPPRPGRREVNEDKVTSLSDVIRARNSSRARQAPTGKKGTAA